MSLLRVTVRRGYSSAVILTYGYDFESFSSMLYFGLYCLIRLFSSASASISVDVVINLNDLTDCAILVVLIS